jgi:hypothetical protein
MPNQLPPEVVVRAKYYGADFCIGDESLSREISPITPPAKENAGQHFGVLTLSK